MNSYDRGLSLIAAFYVLFGIALVSVAFFVDGIGAWSLVTGGGGGCMIATGYCIWRGELVPSEAEK